MKGATPPAAPAATEESPDARSIRPPELATARETPIGLLPADGSLDLDGLDISQDTVDHLFEVDPKTWLAECDLTEEYFEQFGDRVPAALRAELSSLRYHLQQQAQRD